MEALKENHSRFISLKQAKNIIIVLVFVFSFDFLLFPAPVMADQTEEEFNANQEQTILDGNNALENAQEAIKQQTDKENPVFINKLPKNNNLEVKRSDYRVITAYNSEIGQCDNSPCITANGFNVCEHGVEDVVAANFLPFGAKVRLPELFGERIFVVRDRMNARFPDRIDVWMVEKNQAKHFGVKYAKVEMLE